MGSALPDRGIQKDTEKKCPREESTTRTGGKTYKARGSELDLENWKAAIHRDNSPKIAGKATEGADGTVTHHVMR